jgi:hypothetical protein
MAVSNILQRYGIKEVADVTFYEINNDGTVGKPVLVLDSLKVTSIEQTAETAEARGGKGNAKLIVWDFGKEMTVNIEDALFSPKSLSIMMADGKVVKDSSATKTIRKSARVVATKVDKDSSTGTEYDYSTTPPQIFIDGREIDSAEITGHGSTIKWYHAVEGETGLEEMSSGAKYYRGEVYIATWEHPVCAKTIITIRPDSFPGTYYVTGDTMIRSERTGKDEYFQFIIPKAKMTAEQTISLEAEGDPTTFNMTLQVLRPENGEMLQFVKYEFYDDEDDITSNNAPTDKKDGWKDNTKVAN